jgi:carboxypeptidase T
MIRILTVLSLCVFLVLAEDAMWRFKIHSQNKSLFKSIEMDFDVECFSGDTTEVFGTKQDEQKLTSMGFKILEKEQGTPFSSQNPGYDNPTAIMARMRQLEASHPTLAKVINLQETYNLPKTVEGNDLFAVKISRNVGSDEDEPNRLVVSNHHSREMITPQIALDTAEKLVLNYNSDPQVKSVLDTNQIYVMWTMNPDGLNHVWTKDRMWRKNRKVNSGGSIGVDLNRNYGAGWNLSCAGSASQTSETYRGPSPNSEVETQTMSVFQADRSFAAVIDYHSYAREVRINYGSCVRIPPAINTMFQKSADRMASAQKYRRVNSCCTGGQISYAYAHHGSWANLIETGTAFQPPANAMKEELVRIWPGTLVGLGTPIPLSGHVVDARGKPIRANIDIQGLTWQLNEKRYSNEKRAGLYHLWIPEGQWTVSFAAPGFQTFTKSVTIGAQGEKLHVVLQQ